MAQARHKSAINQREKTSMRINLRHEYRENGVSKIFIISVRLIRRAGEETSITGRTVEYGPQSWPITARELTKRYNKAQYLIALFGIPGSSHVWLHTEWGCYWWNDKSWNRSSDWHFSKTAFYLSLSSELRKWIFTEVPAALSEDKRVMKLFHVSTIALRLRA